MKKIILLGDSTRQAYDEYVRAKLDKTAQVLFPKENCQFSLYLFRHLHDWKKSGDWGDDADAVHWNAGLWDALHLFGQETLTDPDYYAQTIRRIDGRIRMLFPRAKVVFATNTPGIDARYGEDFFRRNREIEEYNRRALDALASTDTVIDDLYAAAAGCPEEYYIDAVHLYTPEGRSLLGDAVLNCVCPLIGIEKQTDGSWKERR